VTPFHSLALRVQPSQYVTNDPLAEQGMMSARLEASGDVVPITPYSSPQAVFDALFKDLGGATTAVAPAAQLEIDKRRSILDLVDRGMAGLHDKLGVADQLRLSQHWDEIRALETRLDALAEPPAPKEACAAPATPPSDPPVGGGIADPNGYDASKGYSDEESRAVLMTDMLALAFACDLTRSATLMHTWVQSFMNAATIANVSRTVHDSHHQGGPTVEKTARIAAWHMKHFARLIERLRDLPEDGGSVLDNSVLVYLNEAGIGVDENGVPNSHSGVDMMALVAGGAGGIQQGVHIVAPPDVKDVANVLITAMNAVGVNVDTLGDVSGGEIPGLRT